MKYHNRKTAERMMRKARRICKRMRRDEAVNILAVALSEAILREGGDCEDAIATMDIVHHETCGYFYERLGGIRPSNIVPFKRRKSYTRKIGK